MKKKMIRLLALWLLPVLLAPFLAACSGDADENTATEVDGIPVYDKYASREIDLGLTRDETILNVIEVDGEIRATIGVNERPYVWDEEDTIPYRTEYRYYDMEYVELDPARREKTKSYHEIVFVADPSVDFVVGGELFEDYHYKGVQYHYYNNGEMEETVLYSFEGDMEPSEWSAPFGTLATLMLYEDVPFYSFDIGMWRGGKIERGERSKLFIGDNVVNTDWHNGLAHDFTFHGLIGIDGVPYGLVVSDEKTLLVPLTPETTELNDEGVEIDGDPTGGAFTDGRFGYFLCNTEIWRTDGKESKYLIDLAPHGCSQTSAVRAVSGLSDGRILVVADDKLIELFASDGSEEDTRVYTIGTLEYDGIYGKTDDLNFLVAQYNEQSTNAYFQVKKFEEKAKLNLALLSGEIAMVITPDLFTLQDYVKQGLLAPLEEVAPALFEKDVLIETVVDATRVDGICYFLPTYFDICGESINDPSLLKGGKLFETREEYFEFINQHDPEYFKCQYKEDALNTFTRDVDEWIDWETNTCHFDDGTFAATLEFCIQGCTDEEFRQNFEELHVRAGRNGLYGKYYTAESFSLNDSVASYRFTDVGKALAYQKKLPPRDLFSTDPYTWVVVDFPLPSRVHSGYEINARNLYAVVDDAESRDAAADLLQWMILEDVLEEFPEKDNTPMNFFKTDWDGFSINRDENDRYLRRLLNGDMDPEAVSEVNPKGEKRDPITMAFLRDNIKWHNVKCGKDQYEITWEYIHNADHLQYYKNEISAVIHEEAGRYFGGMITARQAADYVQNRISLYLAEQG